MRICSFWPHKPFDAPNLAQQRLRANPGRWLAYKRLPDLSWKHFAKRKVRWDSQTCCKIPMRICSFSFKGYPTSHMMHQTLRSKGSLFMRLPGWPTRGCQTSPGSILLLVNATAWLAYKGLPDPPWKHKVSQTDLLHDSCVDWPFLAKTLVHVQVFGHTGDRTVKLHK
jgi:hypothetical protein